MAMAQGISTNLLEVSPLPPQAQNDLADKHKFCCHPPSVAETASLVVGGVEEPFTPAAPLASRLCCFHGEQKLTQRARVLHTQTLSKMLL